MKHSRLVHAIAAAALAATLAHANGAAAQGTPSGKIGYVNTDRVIREARASQQAAQALQAEYKKREREIAGGPPAEADRRRGALTEDINLRREEAIKLFIDRANGVIRRIGQQENFDAVFIDANYADKRVDITDRVIKALDAER